MLETFRVEVRVLAKGGIDDRRNWAIILFESSTAAQAFQNGGPPVGCPYEAGADTSKIAMGGVLGQAAEPGGRLRILM